MLACRLLNSRSPGVCDRVPTAFAPRAILSIVQATRRREPNAILPTIGIAGLAASVGTLNAALGPFAYLVVFGVLAFALVLSHPEYGIALFLSTFLMTYPPSLQGSGALTINNLLGAVFILLMVHKAYQENDWWFVRCPEVQLMVFILLMFYLSDRFNGPDPRLRELLGVVEHGSENMRTFLTRTAFMVFFINFIRTPRHIKMIYLVAVCFMITSSLLGVRATLHSGGGEFGNYRASSSAIIAAAWNPNREAMFSILAIAELYYLTTSFRLRVLWLIVAPIMGTMALCVFLTASRSGLLGLGVCVITIIIDERLSLKTLLGGTLLAAIVGVVVLQVTPQKSLERITNLPFTQGAEAGVGSGSLERRTYTWEIAVDMFEKNPILGVGVGNWDLARFLDDPEHSIGAPHSSYFLALCEGGILTLLGFLLVLWRCWRNIRLAERCIDAPDGPFHDLRWVVKSTKTDFVVLIFFSAFADLWQLVILFWLVGIGIVLRRLFEQALNDLDPDAEASASAA